MICPRCEQEILGQSFPQHAISCIGAGGPRSSESRSEQPVETEYLTAKKAERAALPYVAGMTLRSVTCSKGQVVGSRETGQYRFCALEWILCYADSEQDPISAWVTADGIRAVRKSEADQKIRGFFRSDADRAISGWNINSDQACHIAQQHGGNIQFSMLGLDARMVEGVYVPVWLVPYEKEYPPLTPTQMGQERQLMAVRADTGMLLRWDHDLLVEVRE